MQNGMHMLLPLKWCQQRGKEALQGLQGKAQAFVVALVLAVVVVQEVVVVNFSSLNKVVHISRHHDLLPIMFLSCKVHAFSCGLCWRATFCAPATPWTIGFEEFLSPCTT